MLGQAVSIDQDVIQIDYDIDVYHVREDVIYELLESCWYVSKPFGHYQPFKGAVTGPEGCLPFISSCNVY